MNGSDTFSYDANLLFMYNRNFNKHFLNLPLGVERRRDQLYGR
ncbi:MAG: hypothetical protein V8Q54_02545 [Alistipes senegalensis]